ncbi:MAG: L-seryl-tRNA(Sec) selenium transferase [bacterium]|nr:MAG: L-seryl-tRNA(Sec) selenium transferase [bacterium]
MPASETRKNLLRHLPKVDQVLASPEVASLRGRVPILLIKAAVREEIDRTRQMIQAGGITDPAEFTGDVVARRAADRALKGNMPSLRRVINATGVVIHTNLGRSPLPDSAIRQVAMAASGYSTLEYDLEAGKRGSRDDLIEGLLCRVTGAEAATVVNNNAAAVMLVLNTLASGRGAVVSRGELVEIGGSFRIPDVMAASGARLVEVGTTNRTRVEDYRKAIGEDIALLLKVHTSNYRIVGFAEEAEIRDLVELGREKKIPVMVDLGSGCLIDMRVLGLSHQEPTVSDVLDSGVDVVTFSGDKLLGGPQAGIIVGRSDTLERIRKSPMKRALRVGKLTLSALEAVLKAYLEPETAVDRIPTLRMIAADRKAIGQRARRFASRLADLPVRVSLMAGKSKVGGGALPLEELPTVLIALEADGLSAQDLEARLRGQEPPVVGRIVGDRLCLDLRTVPSRELGELERAIRGAVLNAET